MFQLALDLLHWPSSLPTWTPLAVLALMIRAGYRVSVQTAGGTKIDLKPPDAPKRHDEDEQK